MHVSRHDLQVLVSGSIRGVPDPKRCFPLEIAGSLDCNRRGHWATGGFVSTLVIPEEV